MHRKRPACPALAACSARHCLQPCHPYICDAGWRCRAQRPVHTKPRTADGDALDRPAWQSRHSCSRGPPRPTPLFLVRASACQNCSCRLMLDYTAEYTIEVLQDVCGRAARLIHAGSARHTVNTLVVFIAQRLVPVSVVAAAVMAQHTMLHTSFPSNYHGMLRAVFGLALRPSHSMYQNRRSRLLRQ